jgi:hypothetical protein
MGRLRRLRLSRGLLVAHPVVWFTLGVLFAGQLPGEPLHSRLFLVALVVLAVIAGGLHEGLRAGGTLDLHDRLSSDAQPGQRS